MWQFRYALAIIAICLSWTVPAAAEPRRDGIADLDALAAQRSWGELGDHLMDIPPAARDAHWQSLVEAAAVGELTPYATASGSFNDKLAMLDRYYPTFPSLAQSAKFMELRAKIGLDAFRRCFDVAAERQVDPAPCRNHFEDFASAKPIEVTTAKSAAAIVAVKLNHAAAATFYAIALGGVGGNSVCAEPGITDAAVAALGEPGEGREAKAGKLLLERCWEPLKPAVLEAFGKESPGSYYMANSCPTLMAHNALSGLRASRCQSLGKN